jgi:hypothetical protein
MNLNVIFDQPDYSYPYEKNYFFFLYFIWAPVFLKAQICTGSLGDPVCKRNLRHRLKSGEPAFCKNHQLFLYAFFLPKRRQLLYRKHEHRLLCKHLAQPV